MDRSAFASLRGYNYQFHKSVIEILSLDMDGEVYLEGLEDVDKMGVENTELVQVKYLESKKLTLSAVLEPIALMLDDYLKKQEERAKTKYTIYAYFGDNTGNAGFIKEDNFLEKARDELKKLGKDTFAQLTKESLEEFLSRFSLEAGIAFEEMQELVKDSLSKALKSDAAQSELYLYPNAINLAFRISCNRDKEARKISKKDFLQKIDSKKKLYSIWNRLEAGKAEYLKKLKRDIASSFTNVKDRLIYIDLDYLKECDSKYGFKHLIQDLYEKYRPFERLFNTVPITYILNRKERELIEIKKFLLEKGISFNDGFESIAFTPHFFNASPIINHNLVRKVTGCSYEIKIASLETYVTHQEKINQPHTGVFICKEVPFIAGDVVQFHLEGVETYKDIREILI